LHDVQEGLQKQLLSLSSDSQGRQGGSRNEKEGQVSKQNQRFLEP
jgi:hypothetical protein